MHEKDNGRLALRDNPVGQGLLLATLVLLAVGAVMVPSALASVRDPGPLLSRASVRHIIFAVIAVIVLFSAWRFDYSRLSRGGKFPILAATMLVVAIICGALVYVPGIGRSVGGYYRWIRVGPPQYAIGFQPSELIKLALVIFLSAWLARESSKVRSFKTFLLATGLVGVCLALVVREDFGTAVVIAIAAGTTMFLAGVRWYYLAGLAAAGGGAFYALLIASPKRWLRIEAMLDPFSTENPCAYQLRQSLTTIASGGWFGKGLGQGMMKRGFLPEDSTDFIFAILCEELGFVAAAALMIVLIVWMILACRSAARAGDRFGMILAGSLGFLISLQATMHMAVNIGCLPPTGMSMPFISAGGTSLILLAAATSLIVSVSARKRR